MARKYTSKERVEASFKREKADRIPVILGLTVQLAPQAGFDYNEARLDPEKAWKTFLVSEEMFPTDMPRVPASPYLPDVVQARQEDTLNPERGMKRRLVEKENLATFSYRPPKENRKYVTYLEMAKRTQEALPDRAVFADLGGPWSIAADLRGIEPFIFDTFDDKPFVHELMKVCTQLALDRAVAMAETKVYIRIGDPSAGCSLISPKIYQEFVKPYHEQLFTELRAVSSTPVGLHMCGYIDPIMEELVTLPIDWIEIDVPSSLERMVALSQNRIVIRGQAPVDMFLQGTREQIYQEIKRCVDTAASANALMLGPGCSVPYNAPLENIKHFLDAAHKYGSYDYIAS